MVPPIPLEHREEIVKLRDAGYSFRNIRDALMQKGVKYSVIGIGNCYQKIIKNGSIDAQPKQKYSKEMLERIKQELQSILEENSDLTGQQQIDEIKRRLGVTVSMDAVGRYRRMLGWKVMPVASNKSGNKSIDTSNGGASNASQSGIGDSSIASGDGANGDASSDQHHQPQSGSVRTSGYYLHPPDVLLPPELSTVAASLPTLGNGSGGESTTSAAFRLANDAVQRQESGGATVVVGNGTGLELVNNADGSGKTVKAEYGVASTSNVQPQMQLIHTSQGQILTEMPQDGSAASQLQANAAGGMPVNTAIVYPLKQAKFGPMHVFTSRAIIKTGSLKYQVWAGISSQGATSICIWDANCRMRSQFYCTTILEKFYLPFCAERYANKRCVLVQSNDPIYRSIETKTYMDQHGIVAETWVPGQYGAESNPIELIWDEIGDHIRGEVKPRTLDELRDSICNFWATKMTDEKCRFSLKKCSIFSEY